MKHQNGIYDLESLVKVFKRSLTGLSMALSFWGCGPEVPERDYNNPADPARAIETSASPSIPSACLAGDCSPPAGSSFNFARSVRLTPAGCSLVADVKVLDRGSDLIVFALAYCTDRYHLYATLTTYEGTATSATKLITSDCNQTGGDVKSFTVSQGTTAYLAAYVCKNSTYTYTTRVVPIGPDGSPGASALVETLTSESRYRVVWNGVAGTHGLFRPGRMQRFSESGLPIGGPISLDSRDIISVEVLDANWLVLQQSEYSYANCSRIATNGTLQCNNSSSQTNVRSFLGNNLIINGSNGGGIGRSDFNAANCSISGGTDTDNLFIARGDMKYYNSIMLTTTMGAVLVSAGDTLFLATFPANGAFKINAESSVAKIGTSPKAQLQRIKDRVYVSWVSDGQGILGWSSESLP